MIEVRVRRVPSPKPRPAGEGKGVLAEAAGRGLTAAEPGCGRTSLRLSSPQRGRSAVVGSFSVKS